MSLYHNCSKYLIILLSWNRLKYLYHLYPLFICWIQMIIIYSYLSLWLAWCWSEKIFAAHLEELEQLLKGIAMMKELTLRTKDYLVSFGECMSTRIFAAYLNKIGVKARQVCCFLISYLFFNVISQLVFSNDWYMNLMVTWICAFKYIA